MPIHKVLAILVCVVGLIKPVRWCKVSNIFLILCTMSVKDLLLFSGELLKRLHESGIRIDDYKYVQLLKDYEELKSEGNKQTYMVAMLSHRYGICARKIYKLLARMRKDCRERAVE